jgi:hypothetical protein
MDIGTAMLQAEADGYEKISIQEESVKEVHEGEMVRSSTRLLSRRPSWRRYLDKVRVEDRAD